MPIIEFWEEDPNLLWVYRKSYMERLKIERETINYNAWLNGLYVFDAISVSLYNSFSKAGTEMKMYVKEPFDFELTKEEAEIKQRKQLEDNIRKSLRRKKALIEQGEN